MKKTPYMPTDDAGKKEWLGNFNSKFPGIAALFNFSAADVAAVNDATLVYNYLCDCSTIIISAKESFVNHKNLIRSGKIGSATGSLPTVPVLPAVPVTTNPVGAGIFPTIAKIVSTIKSSSKYTDTIGLSLGIIGADQTNDINAMKPVLTLVHLAGKIEVQWVKGNAHSIHIEVDRGTGFQFLAIDSIPHYIDTFAITVPAVWKYRAMYIIADELVGQWSDVATTNVG